MGSYESLILIKEIESRQLLGKLIEQLKKDALLSGVDFTCEESILPEQLLQKVYDLLLNLMINDFRTYLNLLYRVDLSEASLKSIDETDPERIAQIVTLLLLKREWQKVFFKNRIQ